MASGASTTEAVFGAAGDAPRRAQVNIARQLITNEGMKQAEVTKLFSTRLLAPF